VDEAVAAAARTGGPVAFKGQLAEDVPEITELDLNPVIARPDGPHIVDAQIKVTPCEPQDPLLRKLR
jgi:hypothetical protein